MKLRSGLIKKSTNSERNKKRIERHSKKKCVVTKSQARAKNTIVRPRGRQNNVLMSNNNNDENGARVLSPTTEAQRIPLPDTTDEESLRENDNAGTSHTHTQHTDQIRTDQIRTDTNRTNRKKMTELVERPEKLNTTSGNLAENWKQFRRDLEIYMTATESNDKNAKVKIAIFLNLIGRDALKLFDTFTLTTAQKENYDDVLKSFEDFCKPKKNVVFERFMFISRSQKDGESFDSFLMDIKRLASSCDFGAIESEMIRDRIVHGIANKKVQTRLLEMSELTYDKAVEKCRADEATQEQTMNMNKTTTSVDELKQKSDKDRQTNTNGRGKGNNNNYRGNRNHSRNYTNNTNNDNKNNDNRQHNFRSHQNNSNSTNRSNSNNSCKYCNYNHEPRKCPAYGKTCRSCSKMNHFSSVCKNRKVDAINSSDFDNNNDSFFANSLTQVYDRNVHEVNNGRKPIWRENLLINDKVVAFKVDTGSDVSTLTKRLLDVIAPNAQLKPSTKILNAFGGGIVKPIGVCRLQASYKIHGRIVHKWVDFEIVDVDTVPLIGLVDSARFRWIDIRRISDFETREKLKHFL